MIIENKDITQRDFLKLVLVIRKEFICINQKFKNDDIKSITLNIKELKALNKVLDDVLKNEI